MIKYFEFESEIEKISSFLRSQGNPDYVEEITINKGNDISDVSSSDENDELYESAIKIIQTEKKASTSFLQRKLQIGYNRAARIMEQMEEKGVVSKANHTGKREVLQFLQRKKSILTFIIILFFSATGLVANEKLKIIENIIENIVMNNE